MAISTRLPTRSFFLLVLMITRGMRESTGTKRSSSEKIDGSTETSYSGDGRNECGAKEGMDGQRGIREME